MSANSVPTVHSLSYRQFLKENSAGLRTYRRLVEPELVAAMLKDPQFAPALPEYERSQQAHKIARNNINTQIRLGAGIVTVAET